MTIQRVLTVEQYGEVLACVLHFAGEGTSQVLAAFGLDEETWNKNDARWVHELAESKARGQALIAMRFASAHGRARKRLARGELDLAAAASASGLGATARDVAAGAAAANAPGAKQEPAFATPSYLRDGARREAEDAPSNPPPAPAPVAPAPVPTPRRSPTTEEISVAGLDDRLPFRVAGAAAAPPAPTPVEPRLGSGTLLVDEAEAAKAATVLPYPLERWAGLVVELRNPKGNRADILARYRIGSEEQLTKLQGLFRQAFLAEPKLRAQYDAFVMRFMAGPR
jgi:hypothetical protein